MINKNVEILHTLLERNDLKALREELVKLSVVDIADFICNIDEDKTLVVFRILPKDISADVFSYMEHEQQEQIISLISTKEISAIMQDLFIDDAVSFLEEMPSEVVTKVLAATDKVSRDKINEFLRYPEDSGGRTMTAEFVSIDENITVGEALKIARKTVLDKETVYNLYVVSNARKLLGRVPLRTILANSDTTKIKDIMRPAVFAYTTDDQESIAEKIRKYDLLSIPIVDSSDRLCGIVTVDDAIDILTEEATEDVEKMSALKPTDRPYLKSNVFFLSRNRILWLLGLMVAAIFTSIVMQGFEDILVTVIPLAFFIPMLIDTGGSAGSQSSALIIRGLATGELRAHHWFKIMWKEVKVALICGVVLAIANFGITAAREQIWGGLSTTEHSVYVIATIVSLTLIAVVLLAKIVGGLLPLLAKTIKIDPAVMSAPVITTIVDIFGLLIYFTIASAIIL